ncbi:RNA helicase [Flagelloscypha sp. PMI_526]|nr:RNA helicase [Flagelloscypha sp. PMI_526]
MSIEYSHSLQFLAPFHYLSLRKNASSFSNMPPSPICPEFLSSGTCSTIDNCPLDHDVPTCEPCGQSFATEALYRFHLTKPKHLRNVSGIPPVPRVRCRPCGVSLFGNIWNQHARGRKHASVCQRKGLNPLSVQPEETDEVPPGHQYCPTCDTFIPDRDFARHPQAVQHVARLQFSAHEAAMEEASKDKNGIVVEGETNFGILEPTHGYTMLTLTIKSILPVLKTKLVRAEVASSRRGTSPFVITTSPGRFDGYISSSQHTKIAVSFTQTFIGRFKDRIDIILEDIQLQKQFIISRPLEVIVGSRSDHEALRPRAPYKPRRRTARDPEVQVEPGIKPPSLDAVPYVVPLPHANIPGTLKELLARGSGNQVMEDLRKSVLPPILNAQSYGRHEKYLLWIEEAQMERDLQSYDISDAELALHGTYHYLTVPGLAEKRPSVLVGDSILVQRHGGPSGAWFEGRVHVVRREEVGLRFSSKFRSVAGRVYNVRFKLNRYPMRRQHQALDTAFSEARILFPSESNVSIPRLISQQEARLRIKNPLISSNPAQLQAVVSVAKLPAGSVPFVIFGPPGTGKTMTMVEAIHQVLATQPNARIVAVAPSNSAADIIALRLATHLSPDVLFRFYAPSRNAKDVPHQLNNYVYKKSHPEAGIEHFSVPRLLQMKRFKVVVTTCVSASVFYGIGIPRGYYSHIFIDEAGQATEPECMNGVMTMADSRTNIILSGDPKQLGPIIRSRIAARFGLEVSWIERLMNKDELYDEVENYGKTVVKLVKNFRSHEAILRFPNDQFYKGELERCADRRTTDLYIRSSHVAKPGFPVVFYAISGKDDREASSPSFFNVDEVTQVKACVQQLRADRIVKITDNDIGIITPYHAQCLKIRTSLSEVTASVKVGSVEEFQGQERPVIIISTVRSSRDFIKYDLKHTLGFVANPRRFNVAVTRAKALLIVIGDPHVLSLDPLWRSFLNYVYLHGGWKVPDIPWDPEEEVDVDNAVGDHYARLKREEGQRDMNEFARLVESLTLENVEEGEDGEAEDGNVDREWRDAE